MTSGYFVSFIRPIAIAIVVSITFGSSPVHAASSCPQEPSAALERAQRALKANDPKQDRLALECLTIAVTALDEKLEGLRNGKTKVNVLDLRRENRDDNEVWAAPVGMEVRQ